VGAELGLALGTDDVEADHAALRDSGAAVEEILREGDPPVRWAGATLAGIPPMFLARDPDGNSLLVVQQL
jgi:catechol 2,3-dioxygenase-like lactoylglutathione lyase family enzyme